jgi:hypothetical protein
MERQRYALIILLASACGGLASPPAELTPDAGPSSCASSAECAPGLLCAWPNAPGLCGTRGVCIERHCPSGCRNWGMPICGCDGKSVAVVATTTEQEAGIISDRFDYFSGPLGEPGSCWGAGL